MRRSVTLLVVALASCVTPRENWGDDDEAAHAQKPTSDKAAAPLSFVVSPGGEQAEAPRPPPSKRPDPLAVADEPPEAPLPAEKPAAEPPQPNRHEIPVIVWSTEVKKPHDSRGQAAEAPAMPPQEKAKPAPPAAVVATKNKKKRPKKEKERVAESPAVVASNQASPGYDPFQKLDSDLAKVNPPPPATPSPAPSTQGTCSVEDGEESSSVIVDSDTGSAPPPPRKRRPLRDPRSAGLSITVGAGALIASGGVPGYHPYLGYGGQLTWNPAALGDFAGEVGFWRSSHTTGSGFSQVTTADNDASARILFIPRFGPGFYAGVGLGVLVGISTTGYEVAGSFSATSPVQVGGEAAALIGYRISYFEARIDLRTLLTGGLRIEFLPTASVGVTF